MPESTGLEIMSDISDLWTWIYHDLQTHIGDGIEVDFNKILIEGDNAGESPNLEEGGETC
jgi:hypothetical protein